MVNIKQHFAAAVRSKAWVSRPLIAGIVGSNSAEGHGRLYLSLVGVVHCLVKVSASDWSLVKRNHTLRACLCVCACASVSMNVMWCTKHLFYLQGLGRRCQTKKEIKKGYTVPVGTKPKLSDNIHLQTLNTISNTCGRILCEGCASEELA
jgi:hypothetical protein